MSSKKILFICTGNYYRSRFSEAFFNFNIGTTKYYAESRGLRISAADSWALRDGELCIYSKKELERLKIPLSFTSKKRKSLSIDDLTSSYKIIAMDCEEHKPMIESKFPEWESKIVFWNVKDLEEADNGCDSLSPEECFDLARKNIMNLIGELQ